jgi:hypothetical protein
MKKRVRLSNDKVRKLVSERLKRDGTFVHETKIDKAIQQYLRERQEERDEVESVNESGDFSPQAKNAFRDMALGLNEMVEDLRIIQTKEPDVLVDMYPEETYAESYLEDLITNFESVIESLEFLSDLTENEDEDI